MLSRRSITPSIRSDSASAARGSAAPVRDVLRAGQARKARAGDAVRLNSDGAVMTAERANRRGLDAFALASAEAFTNTDCSEARMAGGNHHHHHHHNDKRR
jgi:hypothetical protein